MDNVYTVIPLFVVYFHILISEAFHCPEIRLLSNSPTMLQLNLVSLDARSILCLLLSLLVLVSDLSAAVLDDNGMVIEEKPMTAEIHHDNNGEPCNIYSNEGLHVVLDRICTLCHEMYSDSNPNMRAQCR